MSFRPYIYQHTLSETALSGKKKKNTLPFSLLWNQRSSRRFILFFSPAALFSSNECPNLKGEMISSRAFSCWMEHESVPARPSGTLLANKADFAPSKSKLSTARLLFWPSKSVTVHDFFSFSFFFFFPRKSCNCEDSWRFYFFFLVVSAKTCLSCLIRAKLLLLLRLFKHSSHIDEGTSHETSGTVSLCSPFVERREKKNVVK